MRLIISFIILSLMTLSNSYSYQNKVIYGEDNRKDIYESNNKLLVKLSKSVAVQMRKRHFEEPEEEDLFHALIEGKSLYGRGMCKEELFSEQLSIGGCTAFLVSPDTVVTAGHCVNPRSSQRVCDSSVWVFDFGYYKDPKVSKINKRAEFEFKKDNMYFCKKVVKTVLKRGQSTDYAVIKLDRPVKGRTPFKFRKKGKIQNKAKIAVLGHPSGLPLKIADGANVNDNSNRVYFETNLDTYGGNSGSPVVDLKTGVVEGILVRGATDYVEHPTKGCEVSNVCDMDEGCENDEMKGEQVTRITIVEPIM